MSKPKIYLETTIVSYITARPARDIVALAKQCITQEWWEEKRQFFDLYISTVVVDEISKGDFMASQKRLDLIMNEQITLLDLSEESRVLGDEIADKFFPARAANDGLHIAIAASNGMDHILTWNFTHIGNEVDKAGIIKVCEEHDLYCPSVCSPEALMNIERIK